MKISRRRFIAASAATWGCSSLPLANGMLAADPAAVAPKKHVPWLAEIQQRPDRLPDNAPRLSRLLVDDQGRPITTLAAWEKRREQLRQVWQDFITPLQCERPDNQFTVVEEGTAEGCRRQKVRYTCEPGLEVEGYLIFPPQLGAATGQNTRLPGVVVLHSTVDYTIRQPAGLEGPPEKHFGLKLAKRGFVTFSPKCFLWEGEGNYASRVEAFQKRHPGSLGMAKMLWDAQRGIDMLESLPAVDSARLGAVGHSLGAKEALYLAAFDPRVKVTVSSEGGIGTRFSNWHASWYLGLGIQDGTFTREHHELLALAAPRPFLLIGGDSADGDRGWPFIEAALPVYELYGRPAALGQFNHRKGHAVPPEAERRIEEWFETYL